MMRALFWTFWFLASITFPFVLIVGLWLAVPSGALLRIHDMAFDIEADTMTLSRTIAGNRDLIARWHVSVSDGNDECSASGTDIYEPRLVDGSPKTVAVVPITPALVPCLKGPRPVIVGSWQVLYWGFIPLRETFFFKPPRP